MCPVFSTTNVASIMLGRGNTLPSSGGRDRHELYVDDFLSGANDINSARLRRDQLINLLRAGGFELKKWVANRPELIDDISVGDRLRPSWLQFATEGPVNELGIAWDPTTDCIKFVPPPFDYDARLTKRRILSELARLFDPAGWIGPIIVVAKMVLQDFWLAKCDWDVVLPVTMTQRWDSVPASIRGVDAITLPRWIQTKQLDSFELHVFADASKRAFAAAVYSRSPGDAGKHHVHLLACKTKLAPLRNLKTTARPLTRMTIPRLELRAALLAARLLRDLTESLGMSLATCHAWSDSQVILRWIHSDGPVGNDFVDNYVNHINEVLPGVTWRYVATIDNPADVATRGSTAADLVRNQLWWHGPLWMTRCADSWPTHTITPTSEAAATFINEPSHDFRCCTTHTTSPDFINSFSSLSRLLRAMSRCRRLLRRITGLPDTPPPLAPVKSNELHKEFLTCVKLSQQQHFSSEIHDLAHDKPVAAGSSLASLRPYLDEMQVLRVGGRLENTLLSIEEKHPVILSSRCHLSSLIIAWAHERGLHAGFGVTYAHAISRAWLIEGRARVKLYLRQCVLCAKTWAQPMTQLMAQLPTARVTPSRPFSRTGVDYAGPFHILRSRGRGIAPLKGYVAVFVCLATKAIHLELVGDLTTDSFLGALARFRNRRGRPRELWSDNATNFRGADMELRRLVKEAEIDWSRVEGSLAMEGITWQFIPPSAPHFGGLWEAGVKSMKIHLRRITGPRRLTFEEFSTLLAEIEMVLNGRPLAPLSGEIDDLDALTPAHFLIGAPLTSIPQPSAADSNLDRLNHWRLIRGLRDHFWKRWSKKYLNTLQQRKKWTRPRKNLLVGDLVMLIDPALLRPNGRWPLGRVLDVHPGPDGLVRAATIRISDKTYVRPVTKLVILPVSPSSSPSSSSAPTTPTEENAPRRATSTG